MRRAAALSAGGRRYRRLIAGWAGRPSWASWTPLLGAGEALLLQPQTKLPELRAYLAARERRIAAPLSSVTAVAFTRSGPSRRAGWIGPPIDPSLREKRELLLLPYAEDQIKRPAQADPGLERAQITDPVRLAALRRALAEYREVEKEASTWQA
jgi:hypothetical protein